MMTLLSVMEVMPVVPWEGGRWPNLPDSQRVPVQGRKDSSSLLWETSGFPGGSGSGNLPAVQ